MTYWDEYDILRFTSIKMKGILFKKGSMNMGIFGGNSNKKLIDEVRKNTRRVQVTCPKCGRVHMVTAVGRDSVKCTCGKLIIV